MRFSDSQLDQIRGRLDIAELVKEYVPGLKKAGRHWKACCPFHTEKTPSFMINPDKQIFHCFGCGEGGDLFKFVMKLENMSFPEAVEELAQRAGVKLEATGGAISAKDKERLGYRKALDFALEFYRKQLLASPKAETARKYVAKRMISPESQDKFALGYAPGEGTQLLEAALNAGFNQQTLQGAGLAGFQEARGRYYDFFRDRLLFPIRDSKGEMIGFGGRILGEGEPKYLNSPETPLFSKARTLYGVDQAIPAMRKSRKAVVLEGYTDVIACHHHGFSWAVAPLGTALTLEHATLLKRYAEEVILLFDPDAAGIAATLRGAELLMESDVAVRIATMPEGLDPDEFLEKWGPEAFAERLAENVDIAEFKTGLVLEKLGKDPKMEEKVKAAATVLETILKQPNLILRKEWVRRLAEKLSLDAAALEQEMVRKGPKLQFKQKPAVAAADTARPPAPSREREGEPREKPSQVEEEILQFYLRHPEFLDKEPKPAEGEIASERVTRVLGVLKEILAAGMSAPAAALLERIPEESGWLSGLAMDERPLAEPALHLERLLSALRRANVEKRWKDLQARARSRDMTPEELRELAELGRALKR